MDGWPEKLPQLCALTFAGQALDTKVLAGKLLAERADLARSATVVFVRETYCFSPMFSSAAKQLADIAPETSVHWPFFSPCIADKWPLASSRCGASNNSNKWSKWARYPAA